MPFVPFDTRFPGLAERETRVVVVFNREPIPPDTYAFAESYCDDRGCDCRRVFLNVLSEKQQLHHATIGFGWESREFYRKWMHGAVDEEDLREIQGPALQRMTAQGSLAPNFLEIFGEIVLNEEYVDRVKRHYRMFREAVDKEHASAPSRRTVSSPAALSRNSRCPCGSGKRFKRCCGK